MKTADLNTTTVYMHRKGQYSSESPILVLENRNWTEQDTQVLVGGGKKRVIQRAEKGARVGSSNSTWRYKKTGIPVLKLNVGEWSFREDADDESRIIDSPDVLLQEALKIHEALSLVDTDQNVFNDGKKYRRVHVDARYADGQIQQVTVEFELVRPQDIHTEWATWMEENKAERLRQAEWNRQKAERQQTATQQAQDLTERVTVLLGDEPRYDHNGERYDLHRKHMSGQTYEVSYELLAKLVQMAERSSTQ